MNLGGILGILMIALFILCVIYLKSNKEKKSIKNITLSEISANPLYTKKIKVIVSLASLCGVVFTFAAVDTLGLGIGSLTFVAGIYGSIGMFITGLTIHDPASLKHNLSSLVFYFCLLALPLETGVLLIQQGQVFVGAAILIMFAVSLGISIKILIEQGLTKKKKLRSIKANGIQEVIVMAPAALWVVGVSIASLIN